MPRRGLLKLIKKLKAAPQKTDIKREIADMLGPGVFYIREGRFEPAEERMEAVEDEVAEDGLEPVEEAEEVVEDDEYLGQRVVRRVFN